MIKKIFILFLFCLLSVICHLSSVSAMPPHPLVYDTGPLSREWQALVTKPRLPVPKMLSEHIAARVSTIGTAKLVVILVEFTDVTASTSHGKTYFDNLMFSQNKGYGSMYDYYQEVSDNQLSITGTTGTRWYKSAQTMRYYGADGVEVDGLNGSIANLVIEAVQLADSDIDFAQYDSDGDNIVDHLVIIHAGYGQENTETTNNIWSHRGAFTVVENGVEDKKGYLTKDNVHVQSYTMVSEYSAMGVFAHEFGHDLGLPDLYNTQSTIGGVSVVGDWDLMDGGAWLGPNKNGTVPAHLSVWSKMKLGWITPLELTRKTSGVSVAPQGTNSAYKIPLAVANDPLREYFLLEYRIRDGFDRYLPGDGLLIWHIDDSILDLPATDSLGNAGTAQDLNIVNSEPYVPHRAVDLVEADGTDATTDASDPFPGTGNVTKFLDPQNLPYNKKPANFSMLNIAGAGSTNMTFDYYSLVFDLPLDITETYSYSNGGAANIKIITTNLVEEGDLSLRIFTILGELVKEVPGRRILAVDYDDNKVVYEYVWDKSNEHGQKVASGVYLYIFKIGRKMKTGKIAIIK